MLGTGTVGRTVAGKLTELGHEVKIGSRTAGEDTVEFADAAAFGEVVVNATTGQHSVEALRSAGAENLGGKVLIDIADPLAPRKACRRSWPSATTTAWPSGSSPSSPTFAWSRR